MVKLPLGDHVGAELETSHVQKNFPSHPHYHGPGMTYFLGLYR